jgi:hypothetical protein
VAVKGQFDTAELLGIAAQLGAQAQATLRSYGLVQDGADLGLRAAAMGRRPNAKGTVDLSGEIADCHGWHVDCVPGE